MELATGFLGIAASFGLKVIGAIVLWIMGRWLIGLLVRMVRKAIESHQVDPTLMRYLGSTISIVLNALLIVGILGYFGFQTTSIAALIAALGLAIGMAWSGLLANFAAGVFLMVLRPFQTGEFVTAGGVTGTIREIGLFVTTITTPDNVETFVGNNAIFSGTIQNFSTNPFRRVDLVAQLNHQVDPQKAINLLKTRLSEIPNVIADPAPDVEILEFNLAGPVLAVRPYCSNEHYWQVYFDTNRAIRESFGEAGFPVPSQHYQVTQAK